MKLEFLIGQNDVLDPSEELIHKFFLRKEASIGFYSFYSCEHNCDIAEINGTLSGSKPNTRLLKMIELVSDRCKENGLELNPILKPMIDTIFKESVRQVVKNPNNSQPSVMFLYNIHSNDRCMATAEDTRDSVVYFTMSVIDTSNIPEDTCVGDFRTILNVDIPFTLNGYFLNHNSVQPPVDLLRYAIDDLNSQK